MKYTSYADVIRTAKSNGSSAKTFEGASEFILAKIEPENSNYPPQALRQQTRSDYYRQNYLRRIELRADRVADELGYISIRLVINKAEFDLKKYWPLRKSESSWAGGKHTVTVRLAHSPACGGGSKKAWSKNGKWSGTNSWVDLWVTHSALQYFPTLKTPDGMIVLDAKKLTPREYNITWVEQGRGFNLKTVTGYLIKGHHIKAKNLTQARKKVEIERKKLLTILQKKRSLDQMKTKPLNTVWVQLEDSLAAGNCRPSSEAFAKHIYKLLGATGPVAVRADFLLEQRNDIYTQRAVSAALCRQY